MRLLRAISGGSKSSKKKNGGGGGDSSHRSNGENSDGVRKSGGHRRGWGRLSSAGASSIAEDSLTSPFSTDVGDGTHAAGSVQGHDLSGCCVGGGAGAAAAAENERSAASLAASAVADMIAAESSETGGDPSPNFRLSQNVTIEYSNQSVGATEGDGENGLHAPVDNLVLVNFGDDDESFDEEDLGIVSSSTLRYLPHVVRVSYATSMGSGRHAKPPIRSLPEYDDFQASVLILDLSGFTALGERLVQEHGASEGAARLAQSVDKILSATVQRVYEYGGDVLRFAGDALICLFVDVDTSSFGGGGEDAFGADERDIQEERRQISLRRVHECCLQVLGHVAHLNDQEGAVFTIHGGAAYGPVRRFYLGMLSPHAGDCTYLVAGTPLRRAGKLLDMAGKSEILIRGMNFMDGDQPLNDPFRITQDDGRKFYSARDIKMSQRRFSQTHDGRADIHIHARAYLGTLAARLCDRAEGAMSLLHNELRPVAVIFVGLHDLEQMQPDLLRRSSMALNEKYKAADIELLNLMNDTFLTLRRITHNCHGAVMNMLFDDKGCIFISTFGANSHDHDPRFDACVCAMRMKEALSSLGMERFQLGVSYGDCFCGQVGPAERADFAVLGAEVNMSARLMGKAEPGCVLVSKRVYDASRKHIEFDKSEKIQVKGKDGSFHAYSPRSRINRVRSRGSLRTLSVPGGSSRLLSAEKPFLLMPSREASMEALLGTLQSADDGMPQIVFLTGGPFLGKSSMVRQLGDSACEAGFSVLRSFRTSLDAFTSYFPFRQIAETAMQKCAVRILGEKPLEEDNESVEEERDLMFALMLLISREVLSKTDRAILGSILPDVTDSQLMSLLKGLSPENLTKAIVDSLLKIFRLIQPLFLIFEGDGDIDSASWNILKMLMERAPDECPRLNLIILSRNEMILPSSVTHFKEQGVWVELKPFDRFETMLYLKLLLGIHEEEIDIDETMLDTVHDRANGCPLYVEYIVTWALERRMIQQDDESKKMILLHDDHSEDTAIPRELSNIVLAAFNNLSPTLWDALKIASCIGYSFDTKVYQKLTQTMNLMTKVEELANFYDAFELSLDSNTYKWKHQAVFEAVKSLLIKNQTVQIHGMIADGYEKEGSDDANLSLDAGTHRLLARHFLLAEKWEGAFDQYMEAGQQAEDTFNYPEAARMYEEAIICQGKLASRPSLSSRLLPTIKLGDCLRELARYEESDAVLTRCLKEVECEMSQQKCSDTDQMYVLALTTLATLHQNQSKYHQARQLYETALPIARALEENSSSLWLASHIGGYAEILRKSGELESSEKLHREALEMKEEYKCTELELAVSYTQLGCTLIGLGQAAEAYEQHRSALLLRFKYLGFSHGLVSESLNYCAEALSKLGRSEEGIPLAMHCVSIRKEVFGTSHPAFAHALSILASCYDAVGRYSNAKGLLERCLEICEDAFPKNHANIIPNLMNYGCVLGRMGSYEEARSIFERAVAVHRMNFKEGQKKLQVETCETEISEITKKLEAESESERKVQSEKEQVLQYVTDRTVDVGANGTPIIVLTDIGRDVDDEYALMLLGALTRKRLVNPLAIVTTLSPSAKRAALVKGSLDALGLLHVPVGIGSAGGVEDGKELEVYDSAYRRTSDSVFEDGMELTVISLKSAPDKSVRLLCLASLSDYAALIKKHKDLFVAKVKEVVVMGGLEPLESNDFLQPDTAYNNKCDMESAKYVYKMCQELEIPTVTLSRWAVYGCPVSNELFDELCKTDHMVATNLRRVSLTSINELWRKVNLPFPHPGREKLPERCNRNWFCQTFFGKDDIRRDGSASIWDLVTKLFMYDPLAMLCCVDEFRHEFFRWTTKEVNGVIHNFVGVSESNNGVIDPKALCDKLSYLFRFSLRESLQNIEEEYKR